MKEPRTHCRDGHEFTEANTYFLNGTKVCRICHAAWRRKREAGRPTSVVRCPGCGDSRTIRERQARRIKAGVSTANCKTCCQPRSKKVRPLGREDTHGFWLDRFTQAEIDQMWAGISLYLDLGERKAA